MPGTRIQIQGTLNIDLIFVNVRNIGFLFSPSIMVLTQYRRQKAYDNAAKDLVLEKKNGWGAITILNNKRGMRPHFHRDVS